MKQLQILFGREQNYILSTQWRSYEFELTQWWSYEFELTLRGRLQACGSTHRLEHPAADTGGQQGAEVAVPNDRHASPGRGGSGDASAPGQRAYTHATHTGHPTSHALRTAKRLSSLSTDPLTVTISPALRSLSRSATPPLDSSASTAPPGSHGEHQVPEAAPVVCAVVRAGAARPHLEARPTARPRPPPPPPPRSASSAPGHKQQENDGILPPRAPPGGQVRKL